MSRNAFNDLERQSIRHEEQAEIARDERQRAAQMDLLHTVDHVLTSIRFARQTGAAFDLAKAEQLLAGAVNQARSA